MLRITLSAGSRETTTRNECFEVFFFRFFSLCTTECRCIRYGRCTLDGKSSTIATDVCGEFGWVGCLVVCFLCEIDPNPRKKHFAVGKSGPEWATCNLFFRGLGWPWVGEFVGFVTIYSFPTQQNLVNRKHPILTGEYSEFLILTAAEKIDTPFEIAVS